MEPPLLSGPHLQGSHVLHQVAADYLWSHLLVGKAKIYEHAHKTVGVFKFYWRGKKKKKKEDKERVVMQITLSRHYDKIFQVMSTTNALTSIFWDPSFTLGDCRMDMTDCQD